MVSSLSSLADNLSEGLHNSKCKVFKSCLEFIKVKKNWYLIKILNTNEFRDKFWLMLRKGVYPCEYMNVWEGLAEAYLPDKK